MSRTVSSSRHRGTCQGLTGRLVRGWPLTKRRSSPRKVHLSVRTALLCENLARCVVAARERAFAMRVPQSRRSELKAFLRTRRAALTPERKGISGQRRLTPGLRREDELEAGRLPANLSFLSSPLCAYLQTNSACGSPTFVFKTSNLTF